MHLQRVVVVVWLKNVTPICGQPTKRGLKGCKRVVKGWLGMVYYAKN